MFNKTITTLFICLFFSIHVFSQKHPSKNDYQLTATYTPYHTAMGKGKGVILRVQVSSSHSYSVDSLYVNSLPMKFSKKTVGYTTDIEANDLKNTEGPVPGAPVPQEEIRDEIIVNQKFYPSWLIIRSQGKTSKVPITHFRKITPHEH